MDVQKLEEMWCEADRTLRHSSSWPAWEGEGSDAAACYFEIPPGCRLGPHVHDAEEQVTIVEGPVTTTFEVEMQPAGSKTAGTPGRT
ncbi:MAG TPA: hypothetical protein VEU29_00570, partial [Actinomycetota bacterium]|nr:hypothetical protein [Actinomycetota bacterium]